MGYIYARRALKKTTSTRKAALDPETVERVVKKVTCLFEAEKILTRPHTGFDVHFR